MGMTCWYVVYGDSNPAVQVRHPGPIDITATDRLVHGLFGPREYLADTDLVAGADPRAGTVAAACFDELTIVAAEELVAARPSAIDRKFLAAAGGRHTLLFAMHSVSGFGAFGWWDGDGNLIRSVSGDADCGFGENLGTPLPAEATVPVYERVTGGEWPDLTELVEVALAARLGFRYEGEVIAGAPDPQDIPLRRYSAG
ncbi:MAG: hypothetical protein QM662_16585 [Gordonia sp. (in: high G+C Gram-positive bacteria)]